MKFSDLEILAGIILGIIVIGLLVNYFWANPSTTSFCGDGICFNNEKASCQLDCDWCGDGYCQQNEDCSSCQLDCGNCKDSSFCGDGVCNLGECSIGCVNDCSFLQCEDGECEPEAGENCITSPNDCKCGFDERCDSNLNKCIQMTCGNGVCDLGETHNSCSQDCRQSYTVQEADPDNNYPIIFIHGHSPQEKNTAEYSISAFQEFQEKLEYDNQYLNKGILLPSSKESSLEKGLLGKLNLPVSFRTTYYLGVYDEWGAIIGTEDEQSISTYADRIKEVVDTAKYYTGKNKVVLIAHSMGGLVAREYLLKYGTQNVDTLITIGTPNHGIYGYIQLLCPVHSGSECGEMSAGSSFLANLNLDETPGTTKYLTIAGNCSLDDSNQPWDETIRVASVNLNGATNYVINGQALLGLDTFHGELTSPSRVPQVYNKVISFLV